MSGPEVLVIGGGPAGYVCAIRLAQLGKRVMVVERERVGGVCLNWGCIPVKALLHAAETVRRAAEGRRMGLIFPRPEIDLVALHSWKSRIVDRLVRGVEFLLKANRVELVLGSARLNEAGRAGELQRVLVSTSDSSEELVVPTVVIATGSRPLVIPGLEPDREKVIDSNDALRLVSLPERIGIVGAGVVGLEFATVFSRLGSKVTVLELTPQALPGIDRELGALVQRQMEREGVEFQFRVEVGAIERDEPVVVRYRDADAERVLETDRVLVAAGRRPASDDIGLEQVGVKTDEQGFIRVDAGFRTNRKGIYAIGDVKGGFLLAHKAMAEGISLAERLAGNQSGWRFQAIPICVYTDPELAVVGLTQEAACAEGKEVRLSRIPLGAIGRSLTLGRSEGLCKMVTDAESDRVLGVGMVAPQADALISEAAVAVELGLTAAQLGRVVHPHPTMSELLFEAAEAIHGRAIHVVNR